MGRSERRVVEGERKREKGERESVLRKAGVEGVGCTCRCQWAYEQVA